MSYSIDLVYLSHVKKHKFYIAISFGCEFKWQHVSLVVTEVSVDECGLQNENLLRSS
jgi:hypothetical protein